MIRITSKKDGFRRCGIAHPTTPTDYAADRFTFDELEALKAEPMLTVVAINETPADLPAPAEKEQPVEIEPPVEKSKKSKG